MLVQLGHIVNTFSTLCAANGSSKSLWNIVGSEVCCGHANSHGVSVMVLKRRWFKAWVMLIETQANVWVFRLYPGGHYFYGCVQLLRGIIQLLLFFGGLQRVFWQALYMLHVGLAGVCEVLGPQGPTFKLMVCTHLIWVEISLVLL